MLLRAAGLRGRWLPLRRGGRSHGRDVPVLPWTPAALPSSPRATIRLDLWMCLQFVLGAPVLDEESCEGCHGYVYGRLMPHETL